MAAEEPATLSKSARKRANKKARDAEAVEVEAPPPVPEPKSKAKAKAAPKAEPAPSPPPPAPKAKAKAKEAPPPAKPAAEPKSKAKAQPAPKAEPVVAPKAEPKPKPKPASKQGAKPKKAEPKEEVEPVKEKEKEEENVWIQYDDGKGGDWEEASGLSNKQLKQKQRKEAKEKMEQELKKAGVAQMSSTQHIPGMPTAEQVMAQSKAGVKAKGVPQSAAAIAATAVVSAAAVAAKEKEPVAAVVDTSVTATVKIPDQKIGWVVGPKGATISMIKEKTGVKTIDTSGGVCTIIGEKEAVGLAEHAVKEVIDKGFTSLQFENFQEHGVMVHPCHFPNIIGVKGVIIQAIKKEAKCEVGIPEVPKNAKADKKYKITLSGSAESVEKGKEIINSIVDYGHHEITHPGFVHEEVEVEEWKYKYLIGTKGSEMRHIQNSFHVSVNIPREFSAIKNVVVVGEPQDVQRALKHIEKVMWQADQPKGGRGASEQAIDPWGGEEELEDWMSPYLYKRK